MSKVSNRVRQTRVKSRRNFLRLIGYYGAIVPAEMFGQHLLRQPTDAQASTPVTRPSSVSPQSSSSPGFMLVDVANPAGLGGAINVYGGVQTKRYLMDEMGCGVAFLTTTMMVG